MNTVSKKGEVISRDILSTVSQRYYRITKIVNQTFWNSDSDTTHSLYVGSYGRGTSISTSDIDILVELPREIYDRHDAQKGNGQSSLLQNVKQAIQVTYPTSKIHADGQVVDIDFSDGIVFEVLPAFRQEDWYGNWNGKYDYPDTNMGGKWLTTDPKAEQRAMAEKDKEGNGLLKDTCKHIRYIRDNHFISYHLPGIVIDTFVYNYISDWHWLAPGEESTQPDGTYEKRLNDLCPEYASYLFAPGSNMFVDISKSVDILKKVLEYMSKE